MPIAPQVEAEIAEAAVALEGRAPLETLRWAAGRFAPRLAFATAFGAEGCVLLDLIGRHALPIDVFTLDTGLLFPETIVLWRRLEARYGITIRAVRPDETVEQQAQSQGDRLWERAPDRCCDRRKVIPLQRELQKLDAWVTSIRREQTFARTRAGVVEADRSFGLVKLNPLAAWTSDEVWSYVREHDVPTNPMHARGYPSIGCIPCTSAVSAGEDPRAGRWRGNGKTECGLHVPAAGEQRAYTLDFTRGA